MAYTSKFQAGVAYSNTDINEIFSTLTGSGVIAFTSPNDILSSSSDAGVAETASEIQNSCRVVWNNTNHTEVKILPGTVIMADGSYIKIENEILPISGSDDLYIYIYSDLLRQNIPVCASSLPSDSDGRSYVALAKISGDVISDMRTFARSKISSFGAHPLVKTSLSWDNNKNAAQVGTTLASLPIDGSYSYVLLSDAGKSFYALFDLKENNIDFYAASNKTFVKNGDALYVPGDFYRISMSYGGGVFKLFHTEQKYKIYSDGNRTYTIYLTIF